MIHDIEIYFDKQQTPWQGAQPIQGPPGWNPEPLTETGGTRIVGIRYVTDTNPLRTCQPVQFVIQVIPPAAAGNFIIIYLTDKDHNVIGQIAAQRVTPAPQAVANNRNQLVVWLPDALTAPCPTTN